MLKNNLFKQLFLLLFFTVFTFVVFNKAMGLSLYGDDWLNISKHFGGVGPGRVHSYLTPEVYFGNYAGQRMIVLPWLIFKTFTPAYYAINLLLRVLTGYVFYIFAKKIFNSTIAFFVALAFLVSSIGSQTTEWVFNMNSYLGIAVAYLGILLFIQRSSKKEYWISWVLIILGYLIVPIRLFALPLILTCVEFIIRFYPEFKNNRILKMRFTDTLKLVGLSVLPFLPFLLLRKIFPGLGWQTVNSEMLTDAFALMGKLASVGDFKFLLIPFANLGQMLFPVGYQALYDIGLRTYPMSHFLIVGTILLVVGMVLLHIFLGQKINKASFILTFLICSIVLGLLKIFVKFQPDQGLKDVSFFAWTYTGVIFIICLILGIRLFLKNYKMLSFYTVGVISIASFVYPQLNSPLSLFESVHRYMILSAVGMALVLGSVLSVDLKSKNRTLLNLKVFVLILFCLSHILMIDKYFGYNLATRSYQLEKTVFTAIKESVPDVSDTNQSVFYFENFPPFSFHPLLYFGFGYHIQLLYDMPFKESIFANGFDDLNQMVPFIKNNKISKDDIYGFRYENGRVINITPQLRAKLGELDLL